MEDLKYLKKFSKITVAKACEKTGVKKSNLSTGQVKKEKIKEVREEIESELAKLYIKEEN